MTYLIVPSLSLVRGYATARVLQETAGDTVTPLVVHDTQHAGYTATVNRGLKVALAAGAAAVVCVDDVVPLTERWLEKLKTVLDTREDIWFTGPSGPCRTPPQNCGLPGDTREPQLVSHLAGFCLLIAATALQRLGLLTAELEHYGSDVDYQWRARALGGRSVWVPSVYMQHELHAPRRPAWERDNQRFKKLWH